MIIRIDHYAQPKNGEYGRYIENLSFLGFIVKTNIPSLSSSRTTAQSPDREGQADFRGHQQMLSSVSYDLKMG